MSTERPTGNQSTGPTDDALHEQLNQLQRRVDDLEAENDQLHSELEQTREQQREDRHALAAAGLAVAFGAGRVRSELRGRSGIVT